jgi:hypothetical protein
MTTHNFNHLKFITVYLNGQKNAFVITFAFLWLFKAAVFYVLFYLWLLGTVSTKHHTSTVPGIQNAALSRIQYATLVSSPITFSCILI